MMMDTFKSTTFHPLSDAGAGGGGGVGLGESSGGTDEDGGSNTLFSLTVVASSLSMLGSLVIIALYRSYRTLRSFSVQLLYFLR